MQRGDELKRHSFEKIKVSFSFFMFIMFYISFLDGLWIIDTVSKTVLQMGATMNGRLFYDKSFLLIFVFERFSGWFDKQTIFAEMDRFSENS
jgi:hypothetical protein